jgi:serine phosphatase RsbU (regulator of sigma subunit)/anti-sigma regulatory factor (Ser/Thr protein kinase)
MGTAKSAIVPGLIGVLTVAAVLLANSSSIPPSSPMIAVLVAAALCSFTTTIGFTVAGVAASALLTRFVGDLTGAAFWSRLAFQLVLGAIALFVAWTPTRRTALSGQSLPLLHDVSNELFDAHGMDELGTAVERLAGSLDASTTSLFILEDDRFVKLPREDTAHDDVHSPMFRAECPGHILQRVAERGRSVFWPTGAALVAEIDDCAAWVDTVHARSIAGIPIHTNDAVSGVLFITHSRVQPFDASQRLFLNQIGSQVARAFEKAQVEEVSRSIASELQQSLLGPTVLVPQVGHCSRYLPAEAGLSVGGDWYQTIRLGRGNFGIAVGDALGHGLTAATVMGQLRSALAACALTAGTASEALEVLDRYAAELPGASSTTVVYAVVNVIERSLEYSSAGHPYPLYISPEGTVTFLDGAQGLPLACIDSIERVSKRIEFPAGSTIILFSDGLVERRRESIDVGLERLKSVVMERWQLPIEILADEILDALFADSARTDDVALLVLRSPVMSRDVFLKKVPARAHELAPLRHDLREWLGSHVDDRAQVNAILTAVGEASANAIDHAYADQRDPLMRVEATRMGDELILNVTDTGRWRPPILTSERGRGISMMDVLADAVTIDRRASGTSVTLRHTIQRTNDDARSVHY